MEKQVRYLDEVTIRFAGDSGDGMQLSGSQFSDTSASTGNDVNTFPDYPSEIRAPEGTLYGVSAYQVHFGSKLVKTPGDKIDVLIAMNAASLKVNLPNLKKNGIIIANTSGFSDKYLKLAKYESNPLEDGSLKDYDLHVIDINSIVEKELAGSGLTPKNIDRTKNIFALGIAYWLFNMPLDYTQKWIEKKFSKKPEVRDANLKVLKLGWEYAENSPDFKYRYRISSAKLEPGTYRNITGNEAVALGMVVAARKAKLPLFLGSYPITPATEILHHISGYKQYGIKHLQAEDEIAGICSAIGAAYGGALGLTTTSGPGLSLKVEAIGMAVMLELPLVIVDVQRAGPSTGMPTKTEQADLFIALFGRHGEAPVPVIAAITASDCFQMAFEAARIALKYMTPVILLTDGYLGQSSEPWRIPKLSELPDISPTFYTEPDYQPYKRDPETLARLWALPGTKGLEHRIGGLEKEDITGLVSHDPLNHQKMVELRAQKVERVIQDVPDVELWGDEDAELLLIGWGSTYGAIKTAFDKLRNEGVKLAYIHLKYLNPLPKNLGGFIHKFPKVLVPENNLGQLKFVLQGKYLKELMGLHKIQGQTFRAYEIEAKIKEVLNI
ncbi:MAG: 2-oxoacid:acceptor oxidoreductase subunit alpha [Candidatus Kapabacteria bacterium]|nr:2-oxoacid:acceptor oxidoreductase subunit alpha [Candidatus Kapabacteria bacterium]